MDQLARLLRLDRQEIDLDVSLGDYGMDSLTIADLIGTLEAQYGRSINPAVLLENPTLRGLAAYLDAAATVVDDTDSTPRRDAELVAPQPPSGQSPSEAPELRILKALERGEITEHDAFERLTALMGAVR
jgi:acyl carrier protein